MDLLRLHITYEFVRDRVRWTWRDVYFGVANEILDLEAHVAFARERMGESEQASVLADIVTGNLQEPIMDVLARLADSEPWRSGQETREKWLYLVLAWVYTRRSEYSDPLREVEIIYAAFDYPAQVVSFVRYMPMVGPDLGSRMRNEARLFERWKQYVDAAGAAYRDGGV